MDVERLLTKIGAGSVIGHFQLSEVIGSGGMGLVFQAVDLRLGRTVAVKVLSPDLFENPSARTRFVLEAKIAAAMTHPNVATIHEIDEHDGMPFIVMEMVPGSTLKDLVCDRPLPLPDLVSMAKQVCDALEAAHTIGVIHRDIKSSNIMVTPEGRVKVLDFGLAKALGEPIERARADEEEKTREKISSSPAKIAPALLTMAHGVALGTPSYMSPEQASGKPLDPRTDIFSFGVVLYESASGRLPFTGKSDRELLDAIRSEDPLPLRSSGAAVPKALSRIISTCLSKAPDRRYPSAGALREALLHLEKGLPSHHGISQWMMTHTFGRASAAVMVVLLAILLIRWPPSTWYRGGVRFPAGTKVVLSDLDNQTGEPELQAVQALLESELRQSAYSSIVRRSEIGNILQRMVVSPEQGLPREVAREAAWRLGSPLVASPALLRVGSNYALTVQLDRITRSPDPVETWSKDFRAVGQDGLYDAVDEASHWIRETVGEAAEQIEALDVPARNTTTSSWEALSLFVRAEEAQYAGRTEEARFLLEQSVDLDPDFAMAWGRLADISFFPEQAQAFVYHQKAIEAMARRRLTRYEELRIRAEYAIDSHDFRGAADLFRKFSLTYPRDFVAVSGYAFSLSCLGREQEALPKFVEATSLRPAAIAAHSNAALSHLALERFDDVRRDTDQLRSMGVDGEADYIEAVAEFLQGRHEVSVGVLRELTRSPDGTRQSTGYSYLAAVLGELGRFSEAREVLREGISLDLSFNRSHDAADKWLALAYTYYRSGRYEECRNACRQAVALDKGAERLKRAGALLARAGALEDARMVESTLPESTDITLYIKAKLRVRGEILLSQGDVERAVEVLERVRALDSPAHETSYLARARLRAGDLERAHELYRQMWRTEARLWRFLQTVEYPGLWTDTLLDLARVSESLDLLEEAQEVLSLYLMMREDADPEVEEVACAWDLLEGLNSRSANRPTAAAAERIVR